ncbi:preprotein translocase subunit SecE [Candidatus Daviesbacteria bacterium]|nr:preprotein translocase subunit SecE [Candidatus Daviesbacteria bacterium]
MASPLDFLKEVSVELSKVVWPNRQTAINLTMLVISVSLLLGFFIGILDFGLTKILEVIIRK